ILVFSLVALDGWSSSAHSLIPAPAQHKNTPVWKNPAACVAELSKSHTGTLGDPRISEAGRQFLANLLVQLSDRQIRDLFEVAGVDRRADSSGRMTGAPVDDWVVAFKSKRDATVGSHCT